ncbi:MAG: glycosyltransferase [Cyclobacteriaceae bacterium]|nr:glycosyltransferase [Cyclobacteriaceae bacterium]
MSQPLVSIICICHNHAEYVQEALESVRHQSYGNIQLIAVDDGSSDGSQEILRKWQVQHSSLELLLLPKNIGYCAAFNKGYRLAQGEFIIDLSADDLLMIDRVKMGVKALTSSEAGVNFCDAHYIDSKSRLIRSHFHRDKLGKLLQPVPDGDIYRELLRRYFICAPTMMIKNEVLQALGGYDESLYYEDFDFWVRSSRNYLYSFTDQVLVKKRILPNSMSKSQYTPYSPMLESTARVCDKAYQLNQTWAEHLALAERVRYELRQAVICNQYETAARLHHLLGKINGDSWEYKLWKWILARRWNLSFVSRFIEKPR